MRVRPLGGFEIEGLIDRDLGSRRGRSLLKTLALARGRPVPVGRIADVLSGDAQPPHPADQVGVLVSRLRGGAQSGAGRPLGRGLPLRREWVDVDELLNWRRPPPTAETEAVYAEALNAADGDAAPLPPLRRPGHAATRVRYLPEPAIGPGWPGGLSWPGYSRGTCTWVDRVRTG